MSVISFMGVFIIVKSDGYEKVYIFFTEILNILFKSRAMIDIRDYLSIFVPCMITITYIGRS